MTMSTEIFSLFNLIAIWTLLDSIEAARRSSYYRSYQYYYYYNYYYGSSDDGSGWVVGVAIGSVIGGLCLIVILYIITRWCLVRYKKPTFQVKPNTTRRQVPRPRNTPRNSQTQTTIPVIRQSSIQNQSDANRFQYNPSVYPAYPESPPPDIPGVYNPMAYPPPSEMPPPPVYTVHDDIRLHDNRESGIMSPPPSYSDAVNTRPAAGNNS